MKRIIRQTRTITIQTTWRIEWGDRTLEVKLPATIQQLPAGADVDLGSAVILDDGVSRANGSENNLLPPQGDA